MNYFRLARRGKNDPLKQNSFMNALLAEDKGYLPPEEYNTVRTADITQDYLFGALSRSFDVPYLSPAEQDTVELSLQNGTIYGRILGNNKRFWINIPCRLANGKTCFVNTFFLVDTASLHSYISPETMRVLIGKSNYAEMPQSIDVEIATSNPLELHLAPVRSHFANINVFGTNALAMADMTARPRRNIFYLDFH